MSLGKKVFFLIVITIILNIDLKKKEQKLKSKIKIQCQKLQFLYMLTDFFMNVIRIKLL